VLAVDVVVNSLTLMRYKRTDLGYSFGANFHYRLTCESLIFATFSAVGMGVGLYVSIYGRSVLLLSHIFLFCFLVNLDRKTSAMKLLW